MLPCGSCFRLCPCAVLANVRRKLDFTARPVEIIFYLASRADKTIVIPRYIIKIMFSDVFAGFVHQSVFSVTYRPFYRTFPHGTSRLHSYQSIVKYRYITCNAAINIISDHLHIFIE